MTQYNDDRKLFLQTQIMVLLELDDWSGPAALPDLEKIYYDLTNPPRFPAEPEEEEDDE